MAVSNTLKHTAAGKPHAINTDKSSTEVLWLCQVFSSDNTSAGVYWMFYSGATFESHEAPAGLAGLQSGTEVEGLRYTTAFYWPGFTRLDTLLLHRSLQQSTRSLPISNANQVRILGEAPK